MYLIFFQSGVSYHMIYWKVLDSHIYFFSKELLMAYSRYKNWKKHKSFKRIALTFFIIIYPWYICKNRIIQYVDLLFFSEKLLWEYHRKGETVKNLRLFNGKLYVIEIVLLTLINPTPFRAYRKEHHKIYQINYIVWLMIGVKCHFQHFLNYSEAVGFWKSRSVRVYNLTLSEKQISYLCN